MMQQYTEDEVRILQDKDQPSWVLSDDAQTIQYHSAHINSRSAVAAGNERGSQA